MLKFDPLRKWTDGEPKEHKRAGNFFGPFNDPFDNSLYFFSPRKIIEFDTELYEYEENLNDLQNGHIFALVIVKNEENIENTNAATNRGHYRIKKNLGSKLLAINYENYTESEIMFRYGEGDICKGNQRYETKITFVCDSHMLSASRLEIVKNSDRIL